MTITAPLTFTFTVSATDDVFDVVFPNILTAFPSGWYTSGPEPILTINGTPSNSVYYLDGPYDSFTSSDFIIGVGYPSAVSSTVGQTTTLSAGTFTIYNWFSLGGAMPSSPTTALVITGEGNIVSNTIAVPEPSSLALFGLAGISTYLLRRKRA